MRLCVVPTETMVVIGKVANRAGMMVSLFVCLGKKKVLHIKTSTSSFPVAALRLISSRSNGLAIKLSHHTATPQHGRSTLVAAKHTLSTVEWSNVVISKFSQVLMT